MNNKIVKPFIEHLEFLGYELVLEKEVYIIFQQKEIIAAFTLQSGGIMLRNYFNIVDSAKSKRNEILDYINKLNRKANITRFILEEDDSVDLGMVFWFDATHYDKKRFAFIFNLWKQDTIDLLNQTEGTREFLHGE